MQNTTKEVTLNELMNDPFANQNRQFSGGVRPEDDSRFAHDNKLHVRFYTTPTLRRAKSREAGRPIYEEAEMVEIMVPGDKHSIIRRPVRELDTRRFSRQYAAFRAGKTDQQSGTPLTMLPFISAAKAEEYKFFHIITAEQLAGTADGSSAANSVMGFQADKQKANAYIQMAAGNAPILQMQEAIQEKDNQISAMQEQMNQMNAKLEELSIKAAKKAAKTEE